LTAAAVLGVLTPKEKDIAYAACSRLAQRYMDVWVDPRTGSVNLWDGGRRTDGYRGKHRILGENLSLARQFFYTNDLWNRLGYRGKAPDADLAAWRRGMPRTTFTRFNAGEPQRALITVIEGQRLFGLPFINGGRGQHMHSPYFPLPFSPGLISGVADGTAPQLLPRFVLADGTALQPLAYYTDVRGQHETDGYVVTARLPALDRMGGEGPVADDRISGETRYRFRTGSVEREDVFRFAPQTGTFRFETEFANYGVLRRLAREKGGWVADFDGPVLRRFRINGFDRCEALRPLPEEYATPIGPFHSVVRCVGDARSDRSPLRIGWRIDYGEGV
jgi:hypothetical protein